MLKQIIESEIRKLLTSETTETVVAQSVSKKQILILQRGWIVVGDVRKEGNYFISENTSVIRSWGTKKGIGEIALNGPTSTTKLDPCGVLKAHELATVGIIDCEESKWK
ncbi:MAG: hypothetical protein KAJ40_00620 [Alphaproteobacteria bacterium]|nr:hypothetical protein [Alphaproteobacteria bacterium]